VTVTSTRKALQYVALGLEEGDEDYISPADALATARMALLDQFRANGEEMTTDPVAGEPQPVILNEAGTGWDPWVKGGLMHTGHIIEWTADGRPAANDVNITAGEVTEGGEDTDRWAETAVPEHLIDTGGAVRVKHNLDHPDVIVTVRDKDGEGMGYLFAQEMSRNEVHVEFYAGTTVIRVVPNPDYVEEDEDGD
jgi:hypothetical protein